MCVCVCCVYIYVIVGLKKFFWKAIATCTGHITFVYTVYIHIHVDVLHVCSWLHIVG